MIQRFITKRDTNGNRKTLIIDHVNATYKRDYNPFSPSDYIEITSKARRAIIDEIESAGYTESTFLS